jgi:CO dehydrogenase nickel-insertion accessory protein CooC1
MAKSIAVAGKGGSGKSIVAALLILNLIQRGKGPVLAVDADADSNLGTLLGVEPKQSIGDLREEVLQDLTDTLEKRINQRYLITNMVKPERLPVMKQRLSDLHIEHLCDIPYDPKLEETVWNSESLRNLSEGPALKAINTILERIFM